uniref:Uncharacterized protein n=1 Tax=Panagrolaimus sp. PS1159 TaxID=55785 RepID=A0AC35FB32_9BILA
MILILCLKKFWKLQKIVCSKSGLVPEGYRQVVLPRNVISYETIKKLQPEFPANNVEINPERDTYIQVE